MICPSCGTWNRDEALFCKYCGRRLEGGPAREPAPPERVLPPPAWRPRTWWHATGVFAIFGAFLVFVDAAMDGVVSWSLVAALGLAFLAGGVLVLQYLASADRADRRPVVTGSALLVAAVLLLPVSLALQTTSTTTETFVVPYDADVRNLNLDVAVEAGAVSVTFVNDTTSLVRAEVVHVGGLFASHFEGDVTNTTTKRGDTIAFRLSAKGIPGLFFVGGHLVGVAIQRNVSVKLSLVSTTGDIAVDVPAGVAVRSISASVQTGDVRITTRDAAFAEGAPVHVLSMTGATTVDVTQTAGPVGNVSVYATSTTGRVTLTFVRGETVAAEVRTSTSTGSVAFDASKYEGTRDLLYAPSREAFEAADLAFTVQLTSATGSIAIG